MSKEDSKNDAKSKPEDTAIHPTKIFVRGFDSNCCSEQDLYRYFERFGEIAEITKMVNRKFIFITYYNRKDADRAILDPGTRNGAFRGYNLDVQGARMKAGDTLPERKGRRSGPLRQEPPVVMRPPQMPPSDMYPRAMPYPPADGSFTRRHPANARSYEDNLPMPKPGRVPQPPEMKKPKANEVEIVSHVKSRSYAEHIEKKVISLGLRVDLLLLSTNATINQILNDLRDRGTKFALVVLPEHEHRRCVTVEALTGPREEHINMPLDEAMRLLKSRFEAQYESSRRKDTRKPEVKVKDEPRPKPSPIPAAAEKPKQETEQNKSTDQVPPTIRKILTFCLENRELSIAEIDKVIMYMEKIKAAAISNLDKESFMSETKAKTADYFTTKPAEAQTSAYDSRERDSYNGTGYSGGYSRPAEDLSYYRDKTSSYKRDREDDFSNADYFSSLAKKIKDDGSLLNVPEVKPDLQTKILGILNKTMKALNETQ